MKRILISLSYFIIISVPCSSFLVLYVIEASHAQTQPPAEVILNDDGFINCQILEDDDYIVLDNNFRIAFKGVSYNFNSGKSTWRYCVEELPTAKDLSNWMLELLDCHKVVKATPSAWWVEYPDPNYHFDGIKWQGAGVKDSAEFTVTLQGNWKTKPDSKVGAKGPDVATGHLTGPSCDIISPSIVPSIVPIIYLLLLTQDLSINEFLATGTPDWIEIHNKGNTEVNLQNFYLTNDLGNLTKYKIEDEFYIPANGFVIFYADNDSGEGVDHTNFTLNANAGDIALIGPNGITVVDSYIYGTQTTGQSEGRCPDGTDTWEFFVTPTPGVSNGTCQ